MLEIEKVGKIIINVLVISFLGAGLFLCGRLTGIEEGIGIGEKLIPTPTPASIPAPQPKVIQKQSPPAVKWGGPELWEAVNKRRVENGVNGLGKRDELCTIAAIRLGELRELGKLDGHEGFGNMPERRPDLKWIFDKYDVGEFLIMGYPTPEETVYAWEHTLGHRSLLAGGEWVWGCIYAQDTIGVAIIAY